MQDELAKKRVTITIEPEVHDTGIALANGERRSFSNFVEVLIAKEQERRGLVPSVVVGGDGEKGGRG